jgi:LacI family transcriptional regulator
LARRAGLSGGISTQHDVAALAGVHRATVSRALDPSRRDLVDPETVERVLSAAAELGYRPNALARALKTNRSKVTGLVAPAISSPEVAAIVDAFEAAMREAGYTTLVTSSGDEPSVLATAGADLVSSRAEGIVLITAKSAEFALGALGAPETPTVVIGAMAEGMSTVAVDHELGAELATRHLIRLGHSRIGLIAENPTASRGAAHHRGYRQALGRAGIELDEGLIEAAELTRPASGAEACAALFYRGAAPTAILAAGDGAALGCYSALADFGLRVPTDVSVVGYGNSPYGRYFAPPLTTVSLPLATVGKEAAALILERLGNPESDARSVHLRPYLVQRLSTGLPAPP